MEIPCPHCNTLVNARAKVCAACGKRVKQVGLSGKAICLGLAGLMAAVAVIVLIQGPAP